MAAVITINDSAVTAMLDALSQKLGDIQPQLHEIGEAMMERTKQRFSSSTAPDGTKWAANTQTTLIAYLNKRGGFSDKTGKILGKGQKLAISKKPLIGMGGSGSLSEQLHIKVDDGSVVFGSSMKYAAMQQFGGTKSQFPNLWGDIPARPFLPVTSNGELYPQEQEQILSMLQDYLQM